MIISSKFFIVSGCQIFIYFFRANHVHGGQLYMFCDPDVTLQRSDVGFRVRNVSSYQLKTFQADVSLNYQVAEGEKMNYKQPPKMTRESMPTPQDWNSKAKVTVHYLQTGTSQDSVEESVLPPDQWEARSKSNNCGLPTSFLNSPVKKRSFEGMVNVSSSSSSSSSMSPIKTEPGLRSPLFATKK